MELINNGSTRLVLLVGNFAIKFPRCCTEIDNKFYGRVLGVLEGWKANRYEYVWSKSEVLDFLLPVECSLFFSFIIVMRRAEPITREEFYKLEKLNFAYEHKLDSYGKINGKIYVLDYGN